MLHTEILAPETLTVLRGLMEDPVIAPFYLVGGTALALRFGHRLSIDLDLFRDDAFGVAELLAHLRGSRGFREVSKAPNTLNAYLGEVKVDLIAENDPEPSQLDGTDWESVQSKIEAAVAEL